MAKREVIDILKKYVVLLKSEGIAVEKAFLYGSYSLGRETDDSDIDLMIVTNDKDADNDFIAGKVWQLTRKINTKIEPFLIGRNRFNKNNHSPLIDLIKEKGIEISWINPFPFLFFSFIPDLPFPLCVNEGETPTPWKISVGRVGVLLPMAEDVALTRQLITSDPAVPAYSRPRDWK